MSDNIAAGEGIPFSSEDEGIDYVHMAKELAYLHGALPVVDKNSRLAFTIHDVYIVWFAYVLGGWKALCSTTLPDGRYYEVTYNAARSEAYVDTYRKTHNHVIDIVKNKE